MTGMSAQKMIFFSISGLGVTFKKAAEGYKNDSIKCTSLLRIRANFYGTPTRHNQVTHFDSELDFLKKTPSLMLTNQNNALFIILTNPNKVLCIKIKQSLENSRESVC